jgi:hypothetical protein
MNIVKEFSPEEVKGAVDKYLAKYDAKQLDGVKDAELFFQAMGEAIELSKNSDDEDKQELWENLETDIEEYQSLAYFIEIRNGPRIWMKITEEGMKMGLYEGTYEPFADIKNNVWMDWTAGTQLQIMNGNPNTDAQFFSGDLTLKGSLKLATKPRQWIYDFFTFIGREVD